MKRIGFFIVLMFSYPVYAQGISSMLDKSTNPGEVLVEFDNRTMEVKGNAQLFDEWYVGDIRLQSGSWIERQDLNFDLENDLVEVRLDTLIKVIPLHLIDKFVLGNNNPYPRTFRSCSNYLIENEVPLAGLCEIVDSSHYGLIIKYGTNIKRATYIPALDMGNREDEIIQTQDHLLTIDNNVFPLPTKQSKLTGLYEEHAEELEEFLDNHRLNLRKIEDLKLMLHFLNSLH